MLLTVGKHFCSGTMVMATSQLHTQSMMSRLCAGIAEGMPVAPMADSQAWPQPATQQQVDDIDEGEHDASFEDAGDGFQDDSDGENGYQAGGLLIQLITFRPVLDAKMML